MFRDWVIIVVRGFKRVVMLVGFPLAVGEVMPHFGVDKVGQKILIVIMCSVNDGGNLGMCLVGSPISGFLSLTLFNSFT